MSNPPTRDQFKSESDFQNAYADWIRNDPGQNRSARSAEATVRESRKAIRGDK
ncbi:hypothetical protein FHX42_005306 [Saccharopolyspora lacisalsi]|uniref:Uncharacterized protein n=1 Tax=Halosaccharopolyspora lacisalsi TaxID=1000566 RepID=A0A839E4X3_9PSEU|nr:hypothetical protein [Halosaccharopolyspora lacisalsi]MBA8827899.1 hypothetical protein [Halosaccharopolyspora lacisalsi]